MSIEHGRTTVFDAPLKNELRRIAKALAATPDAEVDATAMGHQLADGHPRAGHIVAGLAIPPTGGLLLFGGY